MSQHHSLPRIYQQDHHQQQQQQHHQSHRHQRYHPDRSPSPSFSPLNDENCVAGRCSPMRAPRHHSRRSSARSSPSPSRWPSPASSASPLGTPSRTMSRVATPSPPIAAPTSSTEPPSAPATVSSQNGFWTILCLPHKLFTCRTRGSARIDIFARVAFPLVFILFNFGYWSVYLFPIDDTVGIKE
ncbi:Glutamate-gated chloride channel isoform X8 [Camponotus japonicus]